MKTHVKLISSLMMALCLTIASCSDNDDIPAPVTPGAGSKSPEKEITAFSFAGLTPAITGTIDATAKIISATIPAAADVTKLVPTITLSAKATVSPASGVAQDFSKEVSYTVTAEDATTQVYKVTVTKEGISNSVSSDQVVYYFSSESKTDNLTGKFSIVKNIVAVDALTGKSAGLFNLGTEIPNNSSPYISTYIPGASGDAKESIPRLYDSGVLYTFQTQKVNALDAKSGNIKWSTAIEDYSSAGGEPTLDNGILFIGGFLGKHIYALDVATGSQKWVFSYAESVNTFTASNGILYVGYGDINYSGGLLAIDVATGKEKWNIKTLGVSSNPAVVDGVVYYGDGKNRMYAVDAITGVKKWEFLTGGLINSSPTVSDGVVFFVSEDKKVYALAVSTGIKKWDYSLTNSAKTMYASLTSDDSFLYTSTYNGSVFVLSALNKKTGERKWETTTPDQAAPALANGIIYYGQKAFDAASGSEKWSQNASKSPCVVIKGKFYPNSNSGMIQ